MTKADFEYLAGVRIAEARALLDRPDPLPDGAYYLAGYAVECALKACIAKTVNEHDWPDRDFVNRCHTHGIVELMKLANLWDILVPDRANNANFDRKWDIVKDWSERSRYRRHILADAIKLVDAVADPADGVLAWIRAHW